MSIAVVDGGAGMPSQPDWESLYSDELDVAAAREEWGVVTRELQSVAGLTVANGHAIQRLVEFRVQYRRASQHVAEHGAILAAKRAGSKAKVGQWNPYWSVMRQCDESIRVLEAELGLAPTRRGKIAKAERKQRAPRAADEFLKHRAG
ncbi:P27 family phage terminase small subunit [Kaistia soli]|nr:P27 family phage terminase small subunit [Kaistia soli]